MVLTTILISNNYISSTPYVENAICIYNYITNHFSLWPQEEDILDMLAQCEADEKEGKAITTNKPLRGPKVIQIYLNYQTM